MIYKYILFDGIRIPVTPDTIEEGCGGGEIATLPSYGDVGTTSYMSRQVGLEYISFSFKIPLVNDLNVPQLPGSGLRNIRSVEPALGNSSGSKVNGMIQGQRLVDYILDTHVSGRSVPIEVVTAVDGDDSYRYSMRRLGSYKVQNCSVTYSAGRPATYAVVQLNCIEYLPNVHMHATAVFTEKTWWVEDMYGAIREGVDTINEYAQLLDDVAGLLDGDLSDALEKAADAVGLGGVVAAGKSIWGAVKSLFSFGNPRVRGLFSGISSLLSGEGFKTVASGLFGNSKASVAGWATSYLTGESSSGGSLLDYAAKGVSYVTGGFSVDGSSAGGGLLDGAVGFITDGIAKGFNFNPDSGLKNLVGGLVGGSVNSGGSTVINYNPPPSLSITQGLADTYYQTINNLEVELALPSSNYLETIPVIEGSSASSLMGMVSNASSFVGGIIDVFSGGKSSQTGDWMGAGPTSVPANSQKRMLTGVGQGKQMEPIAGISMPDFRSVLSGGGGSGISVKSALFGSGGGNLQGGGGWLFEKGLLKSKVSTRSLMYLYEEQGDEHNLCYDSKLHTTYFGVDVVDELEFGLPEGYLVKVQNGKFT